MKELGFTSRFEDLPAWKAEGFTLISNVISEEREKEAKKQQRKAKRKR